MFLTLTPTLSLSLSLRLNLAPTLTLALTLPFRWAQGGSRRGGWSPRPRWRTLGPSTHGPMRSELQWRA